MTRTARAVRACQRTAWQGSQRHRRWASAAFCAAGGLQWLVLVVEREVTEGGLDCFTTIHSHLSLPRLA